MLADLFFPLSEVDKELYDKVIKILKSEDFKLKAEISNRYKIPLIEYNLEGTQIAIRRDFIGFNREPLIWFSSRLCGRLSSHIIEAEDYLTEKATESEIRERETRCKEMIDKYLGDK